MSEFSRVVVDASVAVSWFFPERETADTSRGALALLDGIQSGAVQVLQPPHWAIEVVAVAARVRPASVEWVARYVEALELPIERDPEILLLAGRLARDLSAHVFDTLYHAVALDRGATLWTADGTYLRKSRKLGAIRPIQSFS